MEILTPLQKQFLNRFFKTRFGEKFYLGARTALTAFYLQHRLSEDLDFFTLDEGVSFDALNLKVGDKKLDFDNLLEKAKIPQEFTLGVGYTWSPDSKRLALVIRKQGEEQLELLVFDVENDFKLLLQKDLKSTDLTELNWKDAKTVSYDLGGKMIVEGIP